MKKLLLFLVGLLMFSSCNLQQEIQINLPDYEREIVVECYLEPGKPYGLLLTESSAFGASTLPNVLVPAIVTITHRGVSDTLLPVPTIDTAYYKFYNYVSNKIAVYDTFNEYHLEIKLLTTLKRISASTKFMPIIPINSYRFVVRDDSSAAIRLSVFDPPNKSNFYRLIVNGDTLREPERFNQTFSDDFFDNGRITFFSNFRFDLGDPLILTLHHLTPEHYFFWRSIQDALAASNNPFSVPSRIRSNIVGGTGIFTALSFDRLYVRVKEEEQ
ncbi:MAG: DUF4249 domain-containing protein [Cytophagales bacterium]